MCVIIFQLACTLYLCGCQYWSKVVLLMEGECLLRRECVLPALFH